MKKRIISFILSFCLLITLLPTNAFAALSTNYKLTGNGATDTTSVALAQKNKVRKDFGYNTDWCAYFVCWAGRTAKADFPKYNLSTPLAVAQWFVNNNKGTFYCFRDANYNSLIKAGVTNKSNIVRTSRSKFTPKKGDLICYLWSYDAKQYNWSHIGIVTADYAGKGLVSTVEGNTGGGTGKVATFNRYYNSQVVGIIRPKYATKSISAMKSTISFSASGITTFQGTGQHLSGTITSTDSNLVSIKAAILSGSKQLQSKTVAINTNRYSLYNSTLDWGISIGKLATGNYTLRYTAKTADGTTSTKDVTVTVKPKSTITFSSVPDSITTTQGTDKPLNGIIQSTGSRLSYIRTIVLSGGKELQSKTVSINTNRYSLYNSTIDLGIDLGKLPVGSYVLNCIAYTADGTTSVKNTVVTVQARTAITFSVSGITTTQGTGQHLSGIISSTGSKLVYIKAAILSGTKALQSKTVTISSNSYSLYNGTVDWGISIGKLSPGSYTLRYTAKTADGTTSTKDVTVTVNRSNQGSVTTTKSGYNAAKALAYAKSHWNDGKGICAEFVSDCLKAGGLSVWSRGCSGINGLYGQLGRTNGVTRTALKVEKNGSIKVSNNKQATITPGDVILIYCPYETDGAPYIHAVLVSEAKNLVKVYAHNYAQNNATYYGFNFCKTHGSNSNIKAYLYHFK